MYVSKRIGKSKITWRCSKPAKNYMAFTWTFISVGFFPEYLFFFFFVFRLPPNSKLYARRKKNDRHITLKTILNIQTMRKKYL